MSTRDDILGIIGYSAEVSEPGKYPITGYYTDRHLSPILDGLVEYVERVHADEQKDADRRVGRIILRGDRIYRGMVEQAHRETLTSLRDKVMDLPSRIELNEVGHEVTWVRYPDLLALIDEASAPKDQT